MSMLPAMNTIVCDEGKTKQKVGIEHDINKIVAKYKKTGQMPSLRLNAGMLTEGENVVDLTGIGDYQDCQNKIVNANELFQRYPSMIRRRFDNSIEKFISFMGNLSNQETLNEAIKLGLVEQVKKPENKASETTVNKDEKKDGEK